MQKSEIKCGCCEILRPHQDNSHLATHHCNDCGIAICERVADAHKLVLSASKHVIVSVRDKGQHLSSSASSNDPVLTELQGYFQTLVDTARARQLELTQQVTKEITKHSKELKQLHQRRAELATKLGQCDNPSQIVSISQEIALVANEIAKFQPPIHFISDKKVIELVRVVGKVEVDDKKISQQAGGKVEIDAKKFSQQAGSIEASKQQAGKAEIDAKKVSPQVGKVELDAPRRMSATLSPSPKAEDPPRRMSATLSPSSSKESHSPLVSFLSRSPPQPKEEKQVSQIRGKFSSALTAAIGSTVKLKEPMAVSASEDYIAICEKNGFQVWNQKDWKCHYVVGDEDEGDDESEFNSPSDILIHENEIFVVDSGNHRIQVFNVTDGGFIRMWGTEGNKPGQLSSPRSLAILGPELFVYEEKNGRISVFNHQSGRFLRSWGRPGDKDGEFGIDREIPAYGFMCISNKGEELFIADHINHRILVFNPQTGKFIRKFGGKGYGEGQLYQPQGIATIGNEIYISEAENHRISVFTREGKFIKSWGKQGRGESQFQDPVGLAIVRKQLVVADCENNRLQIFY